jgi:uncharacterized delta-60 repeat protein
MNRTLRTLVFCAAGFSASATLAVAPEDEAVGDPTFGSAGKVIFDTGSMVADGGSIVIRDNMEYVVVGVSQVAPEPASPVLTISRISTSGTPSASFGTGGHVVTSVGGIALSSAYLDLQGRLVVAVRGLDGPDRIARFTAAGALDPGFDGDGWWKSPGDEVIWDIAYADGDGVWVSKQKATGMPEAELIRLTSTGAVDATFPSFGSAQLAPYAPTLWAALTRDALGRLWWASTTITTSQISGQLVVRLTAAGALDTSYSGDGIAALSSPRCSNTLYAREQMIVTANGTAVVLHDERYGGGSMASARSVAPDGTGGPLRCDQFDGSLLTNEGYAVRDNASFFAASTFCTGAAACGPTLRRYLVQGNGAIVDDPAFDVASATRIFATGSAAAPVGTASGVIDDQGKPVIVGYAQRTATGNDIALARYGGTGLVFRDGFE